MDDQVSELSDRDEFAVGLCLEGNPCSVKNLTCNSFGPQTGTFHTKLTNNCRKSRLSVTSGSLGEPVHQELKVPKRY